jgi:ribosomal protein S18 acetylase RimI-like enzyme
MIAARPLGDAQWEICRVYVAPALHGSGLAHALLDTAEGHAIRAGARRLVLFSDTRFDRAHRFYEKRSYVRTGPVRVLRDISNSLEFGYAKPVEGIEALDIAAATSAAGSMAALLVTCVNAGSSLSYLAPLPPDKARAFWLGAARAVGAGQRIVLAGWHNGALVATGTLDLASSDNQPHLAEAQKIMVHPSARRLGLARRMLGALEDAGRAAGRTLLVLDTRAGDAGEALYRAAGWTEYGRLDGHALDPAGRLVATVFFYKRI